MAAPAGVFAPLELEGKAPVRLLVDTGAQSSVITPAAAARLGLIPRYRVEVVTTSGTMLVPATRAATAALPGALAADLELLIYAIPGLDADGVLGQNFLGRFNYLLDNLHGRIDFEPVATAGTAVPFELVEGRPALAVRGAGRHSLRLVLDTGASHMVLFRHPAGGTGYAELATSTGAIRVRTATIAALEIGGTRLANITAALAAQAAVPIEDGLLPAHFFRAIYVNNRDHYVVLNPDGD
jgi:predicted aspartyl protease